LDNRLLAMDRSRLRLGTWNVGRPAKASRSLGGRPLGASSRRLGLDWWPLAVTAITIRNRSIGFAISMPGCRRNRTSGKKLTLKIRPNRSFALQCYAKAQKVRDALVIWLLWIRTLASKDALKRPLTAFPRPVPPGNKNELRALKNKTRKFNR
jgi:hypothetical protein